MSDAFKDREHALEAHQALVDEQDFRARARRNRLLGLWAAESLGITGEDALTYARSVVAADLEGHGDESVVTKVLADLLAGGIEMTAGRLQLKLEKAMSIARAQIDSEASA